MERWHAKVVALIACFVLPLICTVLPYKLSRYISSMNVGSGPPIISCLMCFGGGIFFGTYLLHMGPEVRALVKDSLLDPYQIDYPLTDLIVGVGFLLVLFAEKLVLRWNNNRLEKKHAIKVRNLSGKRRSSWAVISQLDIDMESPTRDDRTGCDNKAVCTEELELGETNKTKQANGDIAAGSKFLHPDSCSLVSRDKSPNRSEKSNNTSTKDASTKSRALAYSEDPGISLKSFSSLSNSDQDNETNENKQVTQDGDINKQHTEEEEEIGKDQNFNKLENDKYNTEQNPDDSANQQESSNEANNVKQTQISIENKAAGHGNAVENLDVKSRLKNYKPTDKDYKAISKDHSDTDTTTKGHHHHSTRSIILILALSLHRIFEGMSIGLQQSVQSTLSLFLAVMCHETVIGFSLGLQFVKSNLGLKRLLITSLVCSSILPVGVIIGIVMTETGGENQAVAIANGLLQAIAMGTFIYVTFFEILQEELDPDDVSLVKIVFIAAGFGMMALLDLIPEEHGSTASQNINHVMAHETTTSGH